MLPRPLRILTLALALAPGLLSQEMSPEGFRRRRAELERAYAAAGSPEEKRAIYEEFRRLDLVPEVREEEDRSVTTTVRLALPHLGSLGETREVETGDEAAALLRDIANAMVEIEPLLLEAGYLRFFGPGDGCTGRLETDSDYEMFLHQIARGAADLEGDEPLTAAELSTIQEEVARVRHLLADMSLQGEAILAMDFLESFGYEDPYLPEDPTLRRLLESLLLAYDRLATDPETRFYHEIERMIRSTTVSRVSGRWVFVFPGRAVPTETVGEALGRTAVEVGRDGVIDQALTRLLGQSASLVFTVASMLLTIESNARFEAWANGEDLDSMRRRIRREVLDAMTPRQRAFYDAGSRHESMWGEIFEEDYEAVRDWVAGWRADRGLPPFLPGDRPDSMGPG